MNENNLFESLCRYIGQTVTVFTSSGGSSGCGFTGVLASVSDGQIKLITDIGGAPGCPLGSNCSGCSSLSNSCGNRRGLFSGSNAFGNNSCSGSNNILGSITEIPVCKIVGFTHNAI